MIINRTNILILVVIFILLPIGLAFGTSAIAKRFWKGNKFLENWVWKFALLGYLGFIAWIGITNYIQRRTGARDIGGPLSRHATYEEPLQRFLNEKSS